MTLRYGETRDCATCAECGLLFLSPPMSADEEAQFYRNEYSAIYTREKNTVPAKLEEQRSLAAAEYVRLAEPHLSAAADCLEIGCASGYFLEAIRGRVRSITGYELADDFCGLCRERKIPLLDNLAAAPAAAYDRIFLFFVLEHAADPVGRLQELRRLLRPGGKLFILVPNADEALLALYHCESYRKFAFTLAHQVYFNRQALTAALTRAGLVRPEVQAYQRYGLANHLHWLACGKPGGGDLARIFTPAADREYARNLEASWYADTLVAVAGSEGE